MSMRTFLAVPCADAVAPRVCQLMEALGQFSSQVKWVEPENLHLTLKFFGNIDDQDLVQIIRAVQPIIESTAPMFVQFAGAGAFPSVDRPRTLWVGLTAGGEQLSAFQSELDKALARRGYPAERRKFHPHLTVGRVRDGHDQADMGRALRSLSDFEVGESTLDEVELIASQLQYAGPVYTTLARFDLGRTSR